MTQSAPLANPLVPNEKLFIVLLAMLAGLAPLAIDTYLPALPAIAAELEGGVPGGAQMTLSAYMLGMAAGMLMWGPVGDRFGRRPPMIFGLAIFVAASVACAVVRDINLLIGLRVIQAMGGCAVSTLGQAAVADVYDRNRSARAFSIINTVFLGAPLIAPTLGGLLLTAFGWRSIFVVLAGFGLLAMASLPLLPETLAPERRRRFSAAGLLRTYGEILTHRRYLAYASNSALIFSGMFAYLAASPFVFIQFFDLSPQAYGLVFGANVVAMMATSFLNSRLVVRLGSDRMLRLGLCIAAAAGLALLVTASTGFGGWIGIAVPTFFFIGVIGLVGSNAASGAISEFRQQAGSAAALAGAIATGLGAATSALVGALADGTPKPMAWVICGASLLALSINLLAIKPRSAA